MVTTADRNDHELLRDALTALDRIDSAGDYSELRAGLRDRLGPYRLIRADSGHSHMADADPIGAAEYAAARNLKLVTKTWTDTYGQVRCLHYWTPK